MTKESKNKQNSKEKKEAIIIRHEEYPRITKVKEAFRRDHGEKVEFKI